MQNFLWTIDLTIFKFFNQTLSFEWLDKITPVLTDLDQAPWFKYVVPALLIFLFLKKFKRTGITYFLFLILSIATSDFVGGKVKKIFLRPRPFQVLETNAIQKSPAKEDRSFYSNHSSNMFTSASYLSAFFPAGKVALYSVAGVIALTRLHTGVHYPSDVTFGALMGLLWGFLFSYLAKYIIHLIYKKTKPATTENAKD
jgi:undecaprenyl-diphosphatase